MKKLLIINPGSTSTKIGIYNDLTEESSVTLRHDAKEIEQYPDIFSQYGFRVKAITGYLEEKGIPLGSFDAFVGRGGLLKPIESGTYRISEEMLSDLKSGAYGQHASNLGGVLAHELAKETGKEAFIADPVVVDELQEVARISGMPEIKRRSIFHALNQKAVAKRYAKETGREYESLDLIVCHMGGGISTGAHHRGRVIDVNNALDGEGAFSPERSGGLPAGQLVDMCFSGMYSQQEIRKKITGRGGLVAYLGTNDARAVDNLAQSGDRQARLIFDAMAYQVSKDIAANAAVLKGRVDAIILTGGIAWSKSIVEMIRQSVGFIAEVVVYPGEDELLALSEAALRVLNGEEEAKTY
ncbi:butyrate kinase [Youngiibacter multivorans]|uniref:Probable butyrate kinase n=1 Tax=Youngiibacter multivorans TaxID=937251 RepID=A0ABS4G3D4_9CLOT|nr:butyrate kinase [Youngiibacter multivorans]MBP1919057.1 butyrate kinase [Youngiibacter multivorans]